MKSLKEALNETRPWGQEPGAEWDEGPEDDIAQKKLDRKDRMAQWKSKRVYPAPGEQKPGFAKSPDGDLDEMDASQPNAPSSMAGPCNECGMEEGHTPDCSRMLEGEDDGTNCPECGAPHGMKHDKGCPLNTDGEPEHMGGTDRKRDIDEEDAVKRRSMRDMLKTPSADDDDNVRAGFGDREGFETKHGEWIENPFWDESGRDEVEPELHYGDAFKKSGLAKRLRWGESSDYDGLPLTEGSMFDRFDTLVGHRFDGTFDARETETMKLRALVKKVVREAWSTRDPDTGEETEHSMDDKDIEDLYVDKDKKHEARGCVREGDIEEMKLSIAGPAFGAASSDTDDQDDDGDEDYKVLTPKKAPEPEQSGTRIKSKDKKSKS